MPTGSNIYGIAVDVGTTSLAIYLIDLITGEVIQKTGEMNPQIVYGEDIISRITYAEQHTDGFLLLQQTLIDTLNLKIREICENIKISHYHIVEGVFVGNTAMHHILVGLSVKQLVHSPYIPAVNEAISIRASEIGLELASGANIYLLPNISGYVGADHSSVILSTEVWKTRKNTLVVDIGTNTEITLAANGRLFSCSCASGPAFEGAHIKDGMRAASGAVERVQIENGEIRIFTINGDLPIGICGSGILDAVAQLKIANLMSEHGDLIECQFTIRNVLTNQLEFLLVPAATSGHNKDITVSRKDINEIQLAKAAIRAGQEILIKKAGITANDIDEVVIAGAFGTYIDISNAVALGMFPNIPVEHFRQVGNAAGVGAIQALVSTDRRNLIENVISKVE